MFARPLLRAPPSATVATPPAAIRRAAMKPMNKEKTISTTRLLPLAMAALALLLTASAYAAAPGIQGVAFNLTAKAAFLTQPDGQAIYSWGYGCTGNTLGDGATFAPSAISN